MAWCGVVELRTLRECRIALGQSQAAFAVMLGVSPESYYRTWEPGWALPSWPVPVPASAPVPHGRLHADGQATRGPAPRSGIVPRQRGEGRSERRERPMHWRSVYALPNDHHLPPAL